MAKSRLRRGIALTLIALVTIAFGFAAIVGFKAYRTEREIFFPPRSTAELSIAEIGVAGLAPIALKSKATDIYALYAPSQNGASVLLVHGAGGHYGTVVPEARILAQAGFGVLLFDLPGHGQSAGEIIWGEPERDAIQSALAWVLKAPDVKDKRIGAFGFSMGGYSLLQVAAHEPRIRALVIAGAPTDPLEQSRWQFRRLGPLTQIPATLALKRSKMPVSELTARSLIHEIAPRPLLMIGGTSDKTVPEFMVTELFGFAREPKELWIVKGAEHGNYVHVAGPEYARRLTQFFGKSLLNGA